jgi:hypothetical protein
MECVFRLSARKMVIAPLNRLAKKGCAFLTFEMIHVKLVSQIKIALKMRCVRTVNVSLNAQQPVNVPLAFHA